MSALRILHLEDDRRDAELIQDLLESDGIDCQVKRVETRDDFIASLEQGVFDLILADFSLPSFDGRSALTIALEKCPDVPFIFVSGTLGEEVAIDALKVGATDYVLKERLSRIVSSVRRALREASERAERKQAEQQLRRSEAFLAEGQRISHTGSWGWTLSTGKVIWSEEQYRMLGFEPEKAEPSVDLFLSALHPEDRSRVEQNLEEATAAKRAYAINYRVVLPDGSIRHLRSVGRPVQNDSGEVDEYIGTSTDITERVQVEAALKRSEERYALAMSAAGEGHWDWKIDTDEYYASPRHLELAGFPPDFKFAGRAEFVARYPFDEGERRKFDEAVAAHFEGRTERFDLETRLVPHGQLRWVHMVGMCLRDTAGRPVRWVGSVSDITERKRAEAALRQSEERHALAVAGSLDGIWDWDLLSGDMFFSARTQVLHGLEPGPVIRQRSEWRTMFKLHPDDAPRQLQAVDDYLAGRAPTYDGEYRVRQPDGSYRWVRMRGLCLRDDAGRATRMAGSITDIDKHKRIEEELRARQEMLDLAQKVARAVAFEWHIGAGEGQNRWSPDLELMYGLVPGAYDGSFDNWKKLVHPEDWPAAKTAIKHAVESGEVAAEYRVVHQDGSVHWLQAKGRMFFDAAGNPLRMVGFMLDVTDRHQVEAELRRLEQQLRQAQRLEAMGTLAGGIAHDFNNILGAILGYGEMALREASKGSRLRSDLKSILAAGERGRALVDRILVFSRSGAGERVPVHVEAVAREALDVVGGKLPANVRIETDLRAGQAAMLGDATQIHQVLMNLATNAVQAMSSGGILSVSLDAVRFESSRSATIGTVEVGDYIVLRVADSGTGIAPEVLEHVFDPFFTTKDVGVGTGLGLSLVHGIVTEVGGAIDVTSTLGAGSTFTIYLPRAGDVTESLADEEPALPRGDGQRVLVIDDEEMLVRLATRTLEELGYATAGFTSSSAALSTFRAEPARFDAVVTDERMPGMAGSALIREVRGISSHIPIVLMSGFVGGAVANRAREAGADDVVQKPLSMRALATSLARVLQA